MCLWFQQKQTSNSLDRSFYFICVVLRHKVCKWSPFQIVFHSWGSVISDKSLQLMSLFPVGSGDASRDRNQSALMGPKQSDCAHGSWQTVYLVCYTRCLLVAGKSSKANLSSACLCVWRKSQNLVQSRSRKLPTICREWSLPVPQNRHFQVQWNFKHCCGRDSLEVMQLQPEPCNTRFSNLLL